MSIILLVLLFVLGIIVVFGITDRIIKYYKLCKAIRKIPGLPTHWLWGNLHQIDFTEKFALELYQWRIENKTHIVRHWIGPFDVGVQLDHPKYLKHVLNEPKAENIYSMLEPWLGQGLLIANGRKWYRNRRLLTPAFHFDILKPYVHVYNECTQQLLNKWRNNAVNGVPVNLCESIKKLTLDVMLQCSCSYQSGCQKETCDDTYFLAVENLIHLVSERYKSLILQASEFLYKYFTPQGWRYRKALSEAHSHSSKIIQQRRDALKEMDGKYRQKNTAEILRLAKSSNSNKILDFLDLLLAAQDEDGYGLTDLEVRHEVDTFMFEGHDTTANGIIFTLYLLALYPEHQEKCREEIKEILRGRDRFDHDDLAKLQYTLWCIKESLRRFSPVFNVFRRLTSDMIVDDYTIPKGVWVIFDLYGIHMDPDVWENPLEFNPLRFHPDNVKSRQHPFAFIPFSAGPRNCIGQNFALDEMRVVIGSILNNNFAGFVSQFNFAPYRFKLQLVSDEKIEYVPRVVLRPSKEIQLTLTQI